jgi:hypothetical protein
MRTETLLIGSLLMAPIPASAEQIKVSAGQPLCIDQESLARLLDGGYREGYYAERAGLSDN